MSLNIIVRRIAIVIACVVTLVVLGIWSVKTFFLPDLSVLQPRIEAQLSQAMKQAVKVSGFRGEWDWTQLKVHVDLIQVSAPHIDTPPVNATNATPRVAATKSAKQLVAPTTLNSAPTTLKIESLDATVEILPLLAGQLHLGQVNLAAVWLDLTHSSAGWQIAGLTLNNDESPYTKTIIKAILGSPNIHLNQLTLNIQDKTKHWLPTGLETLELGPLSLTKQGATHQFQSRSIKPLTNFGLQDLVIAATFKESLFQDISNPKTWRQGQINIQANQLHVAKTQEQILSFLPKLPYNIPTETFLGRTINATIRAEFDSGVIGAFFDAQLDQTPHTIPTASQQSAPSSNKPAPQTVSTSVLSVAWPKLNQAKSNITVNVHAWNLAHIKQLLSFIPKDSASKTELYINQLNPSGTIEGLALTANVEQYEPLKWKLIQLEAKGELLNISSDSVQIKPSANAQQQAIQTPAFGNVSANVFINYLTQGSRLLNASITFHSQNAWIDVRPYLYTDHITLKQLQGKVQITVDQASHLAINVQSEQLELTNDDATIQASGSYAYTTDALVPPKLKLHGTVKSTQINRIHGYLPRILSVKLKQWLEQALQAGTLSNGQFAYINDAISTDSQYQSAVEQNPHFEVSGNVKQGELQIAPTWPRIKDIDTNLTINLDNVNLTNANATVNEVALNVPQLRISEWANPMLTLNGKASGLAQNFMNTVAAIAQLDSKTTPTPRVDGQMNLVGSLKLPLNDIQSLTFDTRLQLQAQSAQWLTQIPVMNNIDFDAQITHQGIKLNAAKANWLGGNVQAKGATLWPKFSAGELLPKDRAFIQVLGDVDLEHLQKLVLQDSQQKIFTLAQQLWIKSLSKYLQGQIAYNAQFSTLVSGWKFYVLSDLKQLNINVPELYQKTAGQSFPIEMTLIQQKSLSTQLRVGDLLSVSLEHNEPSLGAGYKFIRGGVALGKDANLNLPEQGIGAHIIVPTLNADALGGFLASLPWGGSNSGSEGFTAPVSLALQIDELTLAKRQFKQVTAGATRDGVGALAGNWRASVNAEGINGYITWVEASRRDMSGTLTARLQQLIIPDSEIKTATALLDIEPKQIPNIDIEVNDLIVVNKKLGHLKLKAKNNTFNNNQDSGWIIEQLDLTSSESEVNAKGLWQKIAGKPLVSMDITARTDNLGETLTRLGQVNIIKGSQGQLNGNVSWQGTPFSVDLRTLNGKVGAQLNKGQFLKVDPGAGRLLGVFSLQSIPRRLTLDFRDLFSSGFAYDSINVTAKLQAGIMSTENFLMKSAAAEITGNGHVNLIKETQDLRFKIRPDLNAGGVSLAYMFINAPLGAATLLFQWLFREPLRAQLMVDYEVTGSWVNPVVVQRDKSYDFKNAASAPTTPLAPQSP